MVVDPLVASAVTTTAIAGVGGVAAVRWRAGRRALARRTRWTLLPSDSFDPSPETVLRLAAELSRVRPAVSAAPRAASFLRIRLLSTPDGQLRYDLEGPASAELVLRQAGLSDVDLVPVDADAEADADNATGAAPVRFARTELVLAEPDPMPLRPVPLRPDPLDGLARAMSDIRPEQREHLTVCVDLVPVTPGQRRRRIRGRTPGVSTFAAELGTNLLGIARPPQRRTDREQRDREVGKLVATEPMWAAQVLVRAASTSRGRARGLVHGALAALDIFAGANRWRAAGINLGVIHLDGADAPWRRRAFDRRLDGGRFRPRRRGWVTAGEIAGLLKPPTKHCDAPNVLRSGGAVPPPPARLPTYSGQPDLLPLGVVSSAAGPRAVGVRVAETYFSLFAGRSRYGKTEGSIVRFVAQARAGHGCLFLDPHEDALVRMKPYLVDVADRVVEISLAPRGPQARQAGWNLFSMAGRTHADVESRVAAVVDSFASALRWSEVNNRALTLTTMAAQSLCELALHLPDELAPTIFQVSTILSDEDWREAVLPLLSRATADFWTRRFPKLASDATTPVTNLIDRLRSSPSIAALLGSSRSTYDIRTAMDRGQVVLVCPAGVGDKDRLVANFVIYDLLQAALSRRDTPPDRRRPFAAYIDEMQTIDGASRGHLAALLEQAGKFGIRLHAMCQQPTRLTKTTLDALMTNRSMLLSTAVGADSARLLAREWGGDVTPETITRLERYTSIASVTLDGEVSGPFRVRGFELAELFGEHAQPDQVPELENTVDRTLRRRPVAEVLAELDTLDQRIADHVSRTPARPAAATIGRTDLAHNHVRSRSGRSR